MKKIDMFLIGVMVGLVFYICITWITSPYDSGYKQGQIDYANRKIEYCLIKQEDNSMIWEKCNE